MKVKTIVIIVILLVAGLGVFIVGQDIISRYSGTVAGAAKEYYCPMHPNFQSDKPGDCKICGMSLVKKTTKEQKPAQTGPKKILFYRNPMNPEVTSPVPMKDQMGMDYVPVYEEQPIEANSSGIYISAARQQLIGVKKEKVQKRQLTGQILTVGRVAYDPALYTAQQEYIQTFKSSRTTGTSDTGYIEEQSKVLIKSMKQKLLSMGMSDVEISELEKQGRPQQNLYLPSSEDKNVWVYVTIYEYEAGLVKTGTPVEVQSMAYPGQVFEGKVVSITPIIEAATRTIKVRALVDNPDNKLKLEMFVNVAVRYDLGDKLAVSEDAVMHTGTRDIVFVIKSNDHFESRIVTLGSKARGYYEVLEGLTENEDVVTSGNFLIDSETKLNAVLSRAAEPNNSGAELAGHQ
jgi:hypothetical protein